MRARRILALALASGALALAAAPGTQSSHDPLLGYASIAVGSHPPPGRTILAECHGLAPLDRSCSGPLGTTPRAFYVSSCDRTTASCNPFTGAIEVAWWGWYQPTWRWKNYSECDFVAGVLVYCIVLGNAVKPPFDTWEVNVHPAYYYAPVFGSPVGSWNVWITT